MSQATPSTVVCVASHPVDLDNGVTLGPGEQAENVDTSHPHNRDLVVSGLINVIDGTTPRVRREDDLAALAPQSAEDDNDDDEEVTS